MHRVSLALPAMEGYGMQTCGFVTISDHRYFAGVRALVNSIRANASAPITVIDEGLTGAQRAWLESVGVTMRRVTRSIPVDDPRFGCCYALFDIDAAPYDRIICIDPDAIVLEDIRTLFAALEKRPLAAASSNLFRTLVDPDYRRKLRHAFPDPRGRFLLKYPHHVRNLLSRRHAALCSGVVAARREALPELRAAAARYAAFHPFFRLPDQDLLSVCVADLDLDCALLPFEMNAATLHVDPRRFDRDAKLRSKYEWISTHVRMTFDDAKLHIQPRTEPSLFAAQRVRVLHYAGPEKPWRADAVLRPGFQSLWQYYHDLPMAPARAPRASTIARAII